jgi:hypothetical protein
MAATTTPGASGSDIAAMVAAAVAEALKGFTSEVQATSETTQEPSAPSQGLAGCRWLVEGTPCGASTPLRRSDGKPTRYCAEHRSLAREAWKARVSDSSELTRLRREENLAALEGILAIVESTPAGRSPKATVVRMSPIGSFGYTLLKEGLAERDGFAVKVGFASLPQAKAFVKAFDAVTLEHSAKPRVEVVA